MIIELILYTIILYLLIGLILYVWIGKHGYDKDEKQGLLLYCMLWFAFLVAWVFTSIQQRRGGSHDKT